MEGGLLPPDTSQEIQMHYTTLGRTNLRVSVAGLGTGGFSRLGLRAGKSEEIGRASCRERV